MGKNFYIFFGFIALVIGGYSIFIHLQLNGNNDTSNLSVAADLIINSDLEDTVNLKILNRSSDNDKSFDIIIGNNSDEVLSTGLLYELEYFDGSEWLLVPSEVAFLDIGVEIQPNSVKLFPIDLSTEYPTNLTGLFRIRKEVRPIDAFSTQLHHLYVEFMIG